LVFAAGYPGVTERFFCPTRASGGRIRLEGHEARHLSRVRRLGPGALVEVFDGQGWAAQAEVTAVGKEWVELRTLGEFPSDREAACRLTLAAAVPKGERFDWLVEKATELGVIRLVPIVTERSVVDPRAAKLERLRRVVIEASKQCGRNTLMILENPVGWARWLEEAPQVAPRLVAHPGGLPPRHWTKARRGGEAALAVGPEGGFTEDEIAAARGAGWEIASLGVTLLRIETAALAGCAAILALAAEADTA
jgi:16S rRNA (uracil1498-N3)-methyltransferase